MREIKFRAWDKKGRKMHCHDALRTLVIGHYMPDSEDDEFVVMQFTGLLDKNGREIFEGDLLRRPVGSRPFDKFNFVVYEVFYHENDCADRHVGFQMNRTHYQGGLRGTSDFPDFLPKNTVQMEVIGNIYENPELLECK
jgi:uncharacterized phage protein (TIGR01671 family)